MEKSCYVVGCGVDGHRSGRFISMFVCIYVCVCMSDNVLQE